MKSEHGRSAGSAGNQSASTASDTWEPQPEAPTWTTLKQCEPATNATYAEDELPNLATRDPTIAEPNTYDTSQYKAIETITRWNG